MKIHVMVVDDEPIAARATALMVRRSGVTEENITVCLSGRDAVARAFERHPDLAVMDIQMPGINGLEAMRRIREHSPGTAFIVLSAYSDFDYAAKALTLGARDYLLKPVRQEALNASLQKVCADIAARKSDLDQELLQQEQLKIAEPMIKKDFLRALTPEANADERLLACGAFLGLSLVPCRILVLSCRPDAPSVSLEAFLAHLEAKSRAFGSLLRPGLAAVCLPPPGEAAPVGFPQVPLGELSRCERPGDRLLAGCGGVYRGLLELKTSYLEAMSALRFLQGSSAPEKRYAVFDGHVMAPAPTAPQERREPPFSTTGEIVNSAKRYIAGHFARDLTLEEVAATVNLSPYYLSRLFREHTGLTFSDTLLQARIARAKELLARSTSSVKDVAFLVGYNDPNYFSKVFHKATGVKASDYRDRAGR